MPRLARTRLTPLIIVAIAALAPPGVAAAAVCEYDRGPRLSQQERDLRDAISARKSWGLPHSRAFVRRLVADRAARRRGSRLWLSFPATAREAAYFGLRRRFQDPRYTRRLDAYLRSAQAVLGGVSIEDDYPRSPYMLVHLTKDVARHRRAIARRFTLRFVVRRSRYSERQLARIQKAIDWDALEREGINVVSSWTETDRVALEVTTRRSDAAEFVRRVYGPVVHVSVIAADPTFLACNSPATYRVDPDGRTLHVSYVDSGSVKPLHVEVIESPTEVRVGIVSEVPHGPLTADAVPYRLSVTLSEPLGDRVVRSIRSGRRVRPSDE